MLNVTKSAGRKVVDNKDFVAAFKIRVGKVRTDETRSSRDQNSQTPNPLQTMASNARRKSSTVIARSRLRARACAFAGRRIRSNELAVQLCHVREQAFLCIISQDKVSPLHTQINPQRFVLYQPGQPARQAFCVSALCQ